MTLVFYCPRSATDGRRVTDIPSEDWFQDTLRPTANFAEGITVGQNALLQTQTLTTEKFKLRTSCNKSYDTNQNLDLTSFIRINNVKKIWLHSINYKDKLTTDLQTIVSLDPTSEDPHSRIL